MNDELRTKLQTWQVAPRVPPGFQREVWQRIAARQSARGEAMWPRVMQWLSVALARPRYAIPVLALSLTLSLAAAHMRAQATTEKHRQTLAGRYVSSIDPLASVR